MSALDDTRVFREYEPHELGRDGYPHAWHDLGRGEPLIWTADGLDIDCWDEGTAKPYGVKHLIRAVASLRCQRCGHPYRFGGMWEQDDAPSDEPFPPALFDELPREAHSHATAGRVHWSPCDEHCTHAGPYRGRRESPDWTAYEHAGEGAAVAGFMVAQGFAIEAAWRILTVHHLNERKHDLRWWNLAALCQRCHLTIQRKVTMEVAYPWDHSDWFKPHAAAWYALRYRGEHLTHTQTMTRLDELLALGQREESIERMAL